MSLRTRSRRRVRLVDMVREGIDIAIRTTTVLPETMVARQIGMLGRALYAAPSYVERETRKPPPGCGE